MRDLGARPRAAIAIRQGRIAAVGEEGDLLRLLEPDEPEILDADGGLVMPGFVDPHTHLLFAGQRVEEFEARLVLDGADYLASVRTGGGGLSTVTRTRATDSSTLVALVRARLRRMLESGTTTAEVKSGYGLSSSEEIRHLEALHVAAQAQPIDVLATLLAAHFRPPEHREDPEPWLRQIESQLMPQVVRLGLASAADVFCEPGIYSVDQARRLLARARREGLGLHLHADQLSASGGAELAAELGALSADHLGHISQAGIAALAASSTVAVLIPSSVFFVPGERVPPVRQMIEAGVGIALASDCNPGTSPISSQAVAIGLATVVFRMPVAEAIAAATINAAWAAGVGERAGSLEPGKRGDVLVLDADDPRELAYRFGENLVRFVVKGGDVVLRRSPIGPL